MVGGKGDISGAGAPKPQKVTQINIKQAQDQAQKPEAKPQSAADATRNKQYAKPTDSQNTLAANKADTANKTNEKRTEAQQKLNAQLEGDSTKTGLKKDYEVKNVLLEAYLRTRKTPKRKRGKTQKGEKTPPRPSIRTRFKPKLPINPAKTKPAIPGRLRPVNPSDPKAMLHRAVNFIESQPAYQDPNLIAQYAKRLLSEGKSVEENKNFAAMMGLDESIAELDREAVKTLLTERMSGLSEEAQAVFADVLAMLNQPETPVLKPLVLLFLPFPFPFMLEELDDDFYMDDEELFTDEFEEGEEGADGEESEEESEEDFEPDVEASISVNTVNYGKIHMNLSHDSETNQFKLIIKGDKVAEDMAAVIQSSIAAAVTDADLMPVNMKEWHDSVLRITETRSLKINSNGMMNPEFLTACNSIIQTICDNDAGDDDGPQELEAEYKVL